MEVHGGCRLEVLVVDDASTDQTQDVVRALISQYGTDRVRYVRLSCNAGAQVARNRGVLEARGEYIMFVDSDDVPAANGINELCSVLKNQDHVDYAYGQVVMTDMSLNPLGSRAVVGTPYDGSGVGLAGYHWHTMGTLYRVECVKRIGAWNEELICSQDWEYQIRTKLFGGHGSFVPTVVGYWRQHSLDRIGGKSFRDDYAEATEPLFRSIHEHAKRASRNTPAFEVLLAKRLVRHAIYCGANKRPQMKRKMLAMASSLAGGNALVKISARGFGYTPTFLDRFALGALNRAKPVDLANSL